MSIYTLLYWIDSECEVVVVPILIPFYVCLWLWLLYVFYPLMVFIVELLCLLVRWFVMLTMLLLLMCHDLYHAVADPIK